MPAAMLIKCPFCAGQIPDSKFCDLCGNPLRPSAARAASIAVVYQLPAATAMIDAASVPARAVEMAAAAVKAGRAIPFTQAAEMLQDGARGIFGRALLEAGEVDCAYNLLRLIRSPNPAEGRLSRLLARVITRRRDGGLFAAQERYIERIEIANLLIAEGFKKEAAGGMTHDILSAAAKNEADSMVVASIFDQADQIATLLQRLDPRSSQDALFAYARELERSGHAREGLDLLNRKANWAAEDHALGILLHKRLGTVESIDYKSVPEAQRILLAEALIEAGKDENALAVLRNIPKSLWKDRVYLAAMRVTHRFRHFGEAQRLFTEFLRTSTVQSSPEVYYVYALFCEKSGQFAAAQALYKQILDARSAYKDVSERLERLIALPPEELGLVTNVLTQTLKAAAKSAESGTPFSSAVIAGRFEIVKPLGVGGMGVVYQARERATGMSVALKRMRSRLADDPRLRAQFLAEAKILSELSSPNIIWVQETVEAGPFLFLVFEYVDGETLAEVLAYQGKIEPWECARILGLACGALAHAHERGIIHLDIKPANVMRGKTGQVKLMDFGIARRAGDGSAGAETGGAGTPAYMAPEQRLGRAEFKSDLFALGATAYELLTGARPFKAENELQMTAMKLQEDYAPLPEEVPKAFRDLIASCLKPDPAARPANASAAAEALARMV